MLDKYYTQSFVAEDLINQVEKRYDLNSFDYIVEPSAGNGAFSNPLKAKYGSKVIALDLEPDDPSITQENFLSFDTDFLKDKKIIYIGNPPFKHRILKEFLKIICNTSTVFALILPASFEGKVKPNLIHHHFHLKYKSHIPNNAYYYGENIYSYNSLFYIFENLNFSRDVPKVPKPIQKNYYQFVKKGDEYDFMVSRVGCNAGKLFFPYQVRHNASVYNYYIKIIANINEFMLWWCNQPSFFYPTATTTLYTINKSSLVERLNMYSPTMPLL